MIRTLVAASALSAILAAPAAAADVIAEYTTWLDARDTVASDGTRLTSFGAVLAQDRANFHRFGIRQELDTTDPVFTSEEMRAKLPDLYAAGTKVSESIRSDVMEGRGHYVFVRIMGTGGVVTHIDVYEGAG